MADQNHRRVGVLFDLESITVARDQQALQRALESVALSSLGGWHRAIGGVDLADQRDQLIEPGVLASGDHELGVETRGCPSLLSLPFAQS